MINRGCPKPLVVAADFSVSISHYEPWTCMPRHAHDTAGLSVVLCGAVNERVGGADVDAQALAVVTKPIGLEHADRFGPSGARLLAVEFGSGFDPGGRFPEWRWMSDKRATTLAGGLVRSLSLASAPGSRHPDAEAADIRVTVANEIPEVRFGNMHAVATPFTAPETMRVELVPGQGEVIGFRVVEDRVDALVYNGEMFRRVGE